MHGQGHDAIAQSIGKKRPDTMLGQRAEEHGAGEKHGSRFSGGTRDLQDHARENAADRIGQHDRANGLPARGPQVPAGLAKGHWHGGQGLARAGDDHRQGHHGQRTGGGQQRAAHAVQTSRTRPRRTAPCTMLGTPARFTTPRLMIRVAPVVAGVFVEIDPGQHADRRGDHQARSKPGRTSRPAVAQMPPAVM